jgi:hypothetical protein
MIDDIVYGVTVRGGDGQVVASYTVTVFGVDGLAFGPLAKLPRWLSVDVYGPNAAALAARKRAAGATAGSGMPERPKPAFGAAPLAPEGWGQGK